LPEVPGQRCATLARRPPSRSAAGAVLPRGFTLPALISAIAYTNKTVIYGLLFDLAAETLRTIAADRRHLGAQIGVTLVLHTWGSALTHHPHVHSIVSGGGLSSDGALGGVQAGLLLARSRALATIPTPLPGGTREGS
jgi:hypothetical protein